jgi:hypothetical protein
MSWRPFAAEAVSSTAMKSPRPSPRSTTWSSRPSTQAQVDQLAAHGHLLGRRDVIACHVERDHVLVQADAPHTRTAPLLDAPELHVGDRLHVGDAQCIVERGAQALRVRAHPGGSRCVGNAFHERDREVVRRDGLVPLVEDALEHRRQLGPRVPVEPDARERLEGQRQDPVMRPEGADRRRIAQRACPDRRRPRPVPDRQPGHPSSALLLVVSPASGV